MITWNGIKIIDKGFLINLEERKDRLEESLVEFEKNNIIGIKKHDLKIYFHFPIIFNQRTSYSNITNVHSCYIEINNFRNLLYYQNKNKKK